MFSSEGELSLDCDHYYEQGILSSPYFLLPHREKASEGWRNTVKITGTVEDSGTKCLWLVSVLVLMLIVVVGGR